MSPKRRRILFVDDDPSFLDGIRRTLHEQRHAWDMVFVDSAAGALEEIEKNGLDVVVTDVKMPGKDGFKVLQAVRDSEAHRDVPVILLTGHGDTELKGLALSQGAYDLLIKPVGEEELLARLRSAIHFKAIHDELKETNALLEQKVMERTAELEQSRLDIIWRLAKAGERRDGSSINHIVRVGCVSRLVAQSMGLPRDSVKMLFLTAPLHDIGKIAISDAILQKRGPLTPEERTAMQAHCRIGSQILLDEPQSRRSYLHWLGQDPAAAVPASSSRLIPVAATIAMTHHERWDGQGYPEGLSGADIPLEGRIVALADAYDALISLRPYRPAVPVEESVAAVKAESGKQFDPDVVSAYIAALKDIQEVCTRFACGGEALF